jgi:polysaccharide export outer membrane protein
VRKAGGFVLGNHRNMSVLQALALAEGMDQTANGSSARILRADPKSDSRVEMQVDLKKILAGKSPDVPMESNDILFIPGSESKRLGTRALEAMISIGSGLAIYAH